MRFLPRYARLPISPLIAALALLVLLLMIWNQGGIDSIYQHLYLLIGSYLTWGILLPFIQGMVENIHWKNRRTLITGLIHMLELVVMHFVASNVIYYSLRFIFIENTTFPTQEEVMTFLAPSMLSRIIDFVVFFGLLCWMKQTSSLAEQKIQLIETEAQLQKSKLDSLKGQLNPHFLFNTMHAISSMIGVQNEKAREITIKVSKLLRKTLQANEKSIHSLRQELELTNDYLDIERERHGDRLVVRCKVEPNTHEILIPPMCLQPIIENAFKHGVALVEGKTEVTIDISLENQALNVKVINDIGHDNQPLIPSNGIGLSNLHERLQLHYNDRFELEYGACNETFVTQMKLPAL